MLSNKDLSIPLIMEIWVPGMVFVWMFFPLICCFGFFSSGILVSTAILALPIGFLLMAARVYKLTPGYKQIKGNFHREIKSALGIQGSADYAIVLATDLVTKQGKDRLNYYRSYWTMTSHVSKCFLLGALNCFIVLIYRFLVFAEIMVATYSFGMVAFTVLCVLYHYVCKDALERSNTYFIKFISLEKNNLLVGITGARDNYET